MVKPFFVLTAMEAQTVRQLMRMYAALEAGLPANVALDVVNLKKLQQHGILNAATLQPTEVGKVYFDSLPEFKQYKAFYHKQWKRLAFIEQHTEAVIAFVLERLPDAEISSVLPWGKDSYAWGWRVAVDEIVIYPDTNPRDISITTASREWTSRREFEAYGKVMAMMFDVVDYIQRLSIPDDLI